MNHYIDNCYDPAKLIQCLAASPHQGISVLDSNLKLVLINDAALRMLDIPADIIKSDPYLSTIFKYNAERGDYGPGNPAQQIRERIELAHRRQPHDFVHTRPDGREIRVQGTPLGETRFVTFYTDVTQERRQSRILREASVFFEKKLRKKTEEAKTTRDMLLNAVNAISDGVMISNVVDQAILANKQFRELCPIVDDYIREEKTASDLIDTQFRNNPSVNLNEISKNNETLLECRLPNKRWYRLQSSATKDGHTIWTFSDVTSYKKQHRLLQQHTNQLVKHLQQEKELNEMQRAFVSMASHEFRTPLAIIDSNAQRLTRSAKKLTPEMVTDRSERIRSAVERMQYLLNQFLNASLSDDGEIQLNMSPVSLPQVIGEVCAQAAKMYPDYTFHIETGRLPEEIEIDRRLIEQCLMNVVSNAAKYSPKEKNIFIEGSKNDRFAIISVRDNGLGIPENELPRIFNRYFRASTSSGIAGTGIGLSMTNMLVRKHRGKVEAQSVVGEGTTVSIYLPRTDCPELSQATAQAS
jgi:signal transduction histidine kinase